MLYWLWPVTAVHHCIAPSSRDLLMGNLLLGVGLSKNNAARLQQRLQVGHDLRPATRHGCDELRWIPLDGMRDGELHCCFHLLQLHRADRRAFFPEFGLVLILPTDHEAARWIGLQNLAFIEGHIAGTDHSPWCSRSPVTLTMHAEPVRL